MISIAENVILDFNCLDIKIDDVEFNVIKNYILYYKKQEL